MSQAIIKQSLEDQSRQKIYATSPLKKLEPLENTIAKYLLSADDVSEIDEKNVTIVLDLASQMLSHLRSYLKCEEDVENVALCHRDIIVKHIHNQMKQNFEEPTYKYTSQISRDFAFLKTFHLQIPNAQEPLPYDKTPENIRCISSYIFGGFKKSQYPFCKFHSNTERIFACVLEKDWEIEKWIRPPKDALKLFYHKDKQYEPDFIVETATTCYLCELKKQDEMDDAIVQQKAKAAITWCEAATEHALKNNGKRWAYLLIPHTEVCLTTSFNAFADRFVC